MVTSNLGRQGKVRVPLSCCDLHVQLCRVSETRPALSFLRSPSPVHDGAHPDAAGTGRSGFVLRSIKEVMNTKHS